MRKRLYSVKIIESHMHLLYRYVTIEKTPIYLFLMFRISGKEIDRLRMFNIGATRRRTRHPRREKQRRKVSKKPTKKGPRHRTSGPRVLKTQINKLV